MSETIRKRKSYTLDEKVAAIKKLKELNGKIAKTSRELNIDRKCLREWRDNEEKLVNLLHKRKQRKAFFKELEEKLLMWVKSERLDKKNIVNYRRMGEKAHEIAKELKIKNFT
jgi:transposase-like protein